MSIVRNSHRGGRGNIISMFSYAKEGLPDRHNIDIMNRVRQSSTHLVQRRPGPLIWVVMPTDAIAASRSPSRRLIYNIDIIDRVRRSSAHLAQRPLGPTPRIRHAVRGRGWDSTGRRHERTSISLVIRFGPLRLGGTDPTRACQIGPERQSEASGSMAARAFAFYHRVRPKQSPDSGGVLHAA